MSSLFSLELDYMQGRPLLRLYGSHEAHQSCRGRGRCVLYRHFGGKSALVLRLMLVVAELK